MNLARLFPADLPEPGTDQLLTHLMRPEFVALHSTPLSADAFSATLGDPVDAPRNDQEVVGASQSLIGSVVPTFTARLDSLELCPLDSISFSRLLHAAGINVCV
jgi:hypothetical protein